MNEQSNTQRGPISRIAAEALIGKEGLLVMLDANGKVALPDYAYNPALYVLINGGALGAVVDIQPLVTDQQVRIRLNGTCDAGDLLTLSAADGTHDGQVEEADTDPGAYFRVGYAEEAGVDGQLVLVRPLPRVVSVPDDELTPATLIADPTAAVAMTQDALTDSSGGTAATTIAAIGATYDQDEVANAIASLAAQLAKIKTDVTAVRTATVANRAGIASLIDATQAAGIVATE